MPVEIIGCKARTNPNLSPNTLSIECSVEGELLGANDADKLASIAARTLGEMLGVKLEAQEPPLWELIGRRYNLYSYTLRQLPGSSLRIVELGDLPVNVSGALPLNRLPPETRRKLWEKREIVLGKPLDYKPLEPRCRKPVGQKTIAKPVVYAVEGLSAENTTSYNTLIVRAHGSKTIIPLSRIRELEAPLGPREFHCVTGWSLKELELEGTPLHTLLGGEDIDLAGTTWIGFISQSRSYTTILPIETGLKGYIITKINRKPLPIEHGAPIRLFFPTLYGWKHIKWLREIVLLESYEDGYWEARGYHERGLVAADERFKTRNPELLARHPCSLKGEPKPPKKGN